MTESPPATAFRVEPIGRVASPLRDAADAPRQGDEGGVAATIRLDERFAPAAADLAVGDRLVVITWLHEADRSVLAVHPRDDPSRATTGVFATRSADRPNPIGLHEVTVTAVDGLDITVEPLEAVDGTPVVDLKPLLGPPTER